MRKPRGNESRRGTSRNPDKPEVGASSALPVSIDRWPSVYQLHVEPPTFIILESYPELPPILSELWFTDKPNAVYFSTFLRGGDYAGAKGKAYKESQHFTVELLGVYSDPPTPIQERWAQEQGYRQPDIWSDSDQTISVLRTRVYLENPTSLLISTYKPMSEQMPWFPYLESRWISRFENNFVLLGGLGRSRYSFSMLKEFYDHAISILHRDPIKYGRPEMDTLKFYEDALRIHHRLWIRDGSPPGMKQVALEIGLTDGTFKSKWKKTGAVWTRIPPPLELLEGQKTGR